MRSLFSFKGNDVCKDKFLFLFAEILCPVSVKISFDINILENLTEFTVFIFHQRLSEPLLLDIKVFHEDYSFHIK